MTSNQEKRNAGNVGSSLEHLKKQDIYGNTNTSYKTY